MSLAPPEAEPGLPPFAPSTELVEAHAAAMVGEERWETANGLQKFHARSHSLTVLTAIGDQLVAATLDHVTNHAAAFGFDQRLAEQIMFARMAGPIAAVVAEGGDLDGVPETPTDQG